MSQPTCVNYARMDERMADMVTPDGHGYAEPMFNEPVLEPWMDGVLDESLMMAAPSSWDNFDTLDTALAQATPNAFDSMLADCSLPIDSQASSSSSSNNNNNGSGNDLTVSPDVLNISSNLTYPDNEMTYFDNDLNNSFTSFDSTVNASISAQTPESLAGDHCEIVFEQVASAFKDLARARAAADPRPISRKQKQRDASIALYLERLRDTCNEAVAALNSSADDATLDTSAAWFNAAQVPMSSQRSSSGGSSFSASNGFSSSSSPSEGFAEFYSQPQSSRSSAPSQSPSQQPSPPAPPSGGIELVMDLNMNAATSLPRRHRPRTETQRQRYLAVRNHGACEKHKKQHKRCTCIDKEIPLTTSSSFSSQAGIHATNTGVGAGKSGRKASSLRRLPGARGGSVSLSSSSGEDSWLGLCHNGDALGRNSRPENTVKHDVASAGISSYSLLPQQQQAGLDHSHRPGHDTGISHKQSLSRHRGASGDGVSTLPAATGNARSAVALQGASDNNYSARCQNGGVSVNTYKKRIGNRDQSHPTVKNSFLLVFPDGTNTSQSLLGQCQKNGQNGNIGSTAGIQQIQQTSPWLHDRNCFSETQKHPNCCFKDNRDDCHLKRPPTMTSERRAHLLTHLPPTVHLALSSTTSSQLLENYNMARDVSIESTPSILLQQLGSTTSPAYAGLRWFLRVCNNCMPLQSKYATPYQREYALWCFIWVSILLLSSILKGTLV